MTTISPCPFCAYEDVEISEIGLAEYAVDCPECGAIGPTQDTVMDSISFWNDQKRLSNALEAKQHPKSITYDLAKAASGALLVGCAVSKTFVPALEEVAQALAQRHPKATTDQVLDMIFMRGLVGFTDDLNLPRVGSNTDTDS